MGWLFRKSFKILPGVRVNVGKKGITSATIGKGLFSTNLSKKGIRHSASVPGTGLRYQTKTTPFASSPIQEQSFLQTTWHCDQCGSLNVATNNFCGICGQLCSGLFMAPEPVYQPQLPSVNQHTTRNSWLVLGAIIIGSIGVVAIISMMNNRSGTQPTRQFVQTVSMPTPTPAPANAKKTAVSKAKTKSKAANVAAANSISDAAINENYSRPSDSPGRLYGSPKTSISSSKYTLGPRGGCYYINGSGKKTYVDHSLCY